MAQLKIGQQAPDFTLPDQYGKEHALSQYRGKWVLLYFYPKDDTTGCTKEACGFRDVLKEYDARRIVILGVSVDPVRRHAAFAEKYALLFPILSDEQKQVVNRYGVWAKKKMMGHEYMGTLRMSFLIDPKGKIAKIYEHVKPDLHPSEVLEDAAGMNAT